MANTIGFGQAAVNNTNGFGKAATNNTIDFGEVCADSWSPETNLTGTGGVPPFSNTKSIELDGVDDYVDCGNVTSLNGLANGSVSMWFKTSNTAGQIFMAKWASGQQQFYAILFPNTRIDVYTDTIGFRSTDSIALADGNWHHLAITLDGGLTGNQRFKVYVDATPLTNLGFSGATAFPTSTSDLLIGKRNDYGFSEWNGHLDEVSIWTKTLSSLEVSALYDNGPTNLSAESNLANWWRFEGTGLTATDSGSGGNDGTLVNGVIRSTDVPT